MSLFNRPVWAKQLDSDEDDDNAGGNIFSHSHAYKDIVADAERRKKEKADRKKAKVERRRSSNKEVKQEKDRENTPKRRRITFEDGEKLLSSVGLSSKLERQNHDDEDITYEETPVRRSPRKQRHSDFLEPRAASKPHRSTEVIDIGESSDEHEEPSAAAGAKSSAPPAEVIEDESDEEFAELARRAREQRRQQKSHTPNGTAASPNPGSGTSEPAPDRPPPPDPTIQFLISSPIENTNPIIVYRKMSQRVQEIRKAWCQKQGFSEEFTKTVFFVHNLRRVWDVTTCRSLGLDADQWGNVFMQGAEGKEGVEKVHLEAVTDEIFAQMKAERERERKAEAGEVVEEEVPEPEPEEKVTRIVLKAKGREDVRLKVHPTTTGEKIARAYCRQRLQGSTQKVRLEFDGETLEPDQEIQDTEIADMDCIMVYMVG